MSDRLISAQALIEDIEQRYFKGKVTLRELIDEQPIACDLKRYAKVWKRHIKTGYCLKTCSISYRKEASTMSEIDKTTIINNVELPKSWKCPHCGKRTKLDIYAQQTFEEEGKVIRQCGDCGYLHIWELKLTEDFKKAVVDMLLKGGRP